ncbi:hypothetical protein, partial [Aquabacterium parvum]|uniref:hypothetical protein n=1 Tax=Aquabacterium parvum TaxID=70584 RepID=UPI001F23922B
RGKWVGHRLNARCGNNRDSRSTITGTTCPSRLSRNRKGRSLLTAYEASTFFGDEQWGHVDGNQVTGLDFGEGLVGGENVATSAQCG